MKITRHLFPVLLPALCTVFAGCDDESTIPQQRTDYPKLISQIRETDAADGGETVLYDFLYDDLQRVKQTIITRTEDGDINTEIIEYAYGPGRVVATEARSGYKDTFGFDAGGYCTSVLFAESEPFFPKYNANGYYYEEPVPGHWGLYEYHLLGNQCNIHKITHYLGKDKNKDKESECIFAYGELPNDANLDLAYLVAKEHYSLDDAQTETAMLFGWLGKRNGALPTSVEMTRFYTQDQTAEVYRFDYTVDSEGLIVRIKESRDGTANTEYRITYL